MAKQLNVNLSVQADTSQAKQAMMELQKSLNDIIATRTITVNDESINNAKKAAIDLKHHLENATNANTGKLDLSKLTTSLNKSGQSLQTLYNQLSQIGPQGQATFLSLAQSIAKADSSAISLGSKLGGLATTLKNTAKWQISSSLLHGFMGAIQGAYGYAQDLNESLNNIRIVTGQNIDQMAKFAKEANASAQALNTTTTAYTDASLIYYQQGLSDEEVKARTDATIKLANVSRQSAEEVSSQMTAIWNNFADGNDNLEYYEDVITKLGASTASSSSEIAEGLQKFAAVADTVDLSYEKSSAALATVVAETRQSADTVGTAFKTIFARLEGLNLGETLDDGTTLNKYSSALKKIGVNIKDSSGEMKTMDNILDEMGEKWQDLSKDQQVATAQTVAGVRQYTQFISLMDNYDKVQKNEDIAKNSKGTVDEQSKIYAESWEAARDRVKAASEEIYGALLNDQAFIDILNGVEKVLNFIGDLVNSLGGLKGILLTISTIFMQYYAKEMPVFMSKASEGIKIVTGVAEDQRKKMLASSREIVDSMSNMTDSQGLNAQVSSMKEVSYMYEELANKRHTLSSAEIEAYEQKIKDVEMYGKIAEGIGNEIDKINEKSEALKRQASTQIGNQNINNNETNNEEFEKGLEQQKQVAAKNFSSSFEEGLKASQNGASEEEIKKITEATQKAKEKFENLDKIITKLKNGTLTKKDLFNGLQGAAEQVGRMEQALEKTNQKTKIWNKNIEDLGKDGSKDIEQIKSEMQAYIKSLEKAGIETEDLGKELEEIDDKAGLEKINNDLKQIGETDIKSNIALSENELELFTNKLIDLGADSTLIEQLTNQWKKGAQATTEYDAAMEEVQQNQNETLNHTAQMSEAFSKVGSVVTQVGAAISSLSGLKDVFSDEDATAGEKIIAVMTALSTLLPVVTTAYSAYTAIKKVDWITSLKSVAATAKEIALKVGKNIVTAAATAVLGAETVAQWNLNAAMDANPIGAVIAAVVAFIAVLTALILIIASVINSESEQDKALKAEQKTAEELKNIYDDLKNKYEELKQSISDYNNALNAIKKLTKGTLEWKDAVREANEYAMKLIQTYKLIKGKDYTIDEDGIIQISDQTQKRVVEEQADNLTTVQTAQMESEKRVANAETDKAKADAQKNLGASVDKDDTLDKLEKYITEGGYLEKYQSGEMTAGAIWKKIQEDNNLADSTFLGNQNAGKSMEKVLDYVEKKEAAADTTKQTNEAIGTTYASQDPNVQASKNKEALEKAASRVYEQINDENYDDITDKIKNATDEQKKEYAKQYAKISGLDQIKGYKFDHMDSEDGMIHYKYINDDGDEKTGEVSGKTVKTVLASNDNQADMAEILQQLDTAITKLQQSAEQTDNKGDKAIASMLSSQDLGTANKIEADSFVSGSGGAEGSYDDMKKYLQDRLGIKELNDDAAKKLGFESAKVMIETFQEQRDGIKKEWDTVTKNLGETGLKDFEKLSLDSAKKLSDAFEKIKLGGNGDQAVKDLSKELNGLVANLPEEDKLKALEELGSIDWTSWDAMDQAKNVLAKFNVTVDEGSNSWKNLTNQIRTATGAMPDAAAEMEKLKKVIVATNKLEKGKTVDAETYETLINQTKAWEKYFQVQADGTYKFIGNAEEMKKANAETFAENKKSLEEFEKLQGKFKQVTFTDNQGKIQPINWGNASGSTSAAEYLSKNADNQNVQAVLNKYGWSKKDLDETISAAQETTINEKGEKVLTEEAKKAQERLNALYGNIDKLSKTNYENEKQRQDDIYASTADTYEKLATLKNNISQEAYDKQVEVIKQETLAAAESLEELDKAMSYVEQNGATVTFEEQSKALTDLAAKYKNTTKELKDYNDAIANIVSSDGGTTMTLESENAITEATDNLRAAILAGEAADKYSLDTDVIEAQAKAIKNVNSDLNMTSEQATKVAIANQRMNAGIKTLNESFKEWKKTLQTADKASMDYAEAVAKTTAAIKNLLGVSDEWELPEGFLESAEHLKWLSEAAEGSEAAINKIGLASAKASVETAEMNEAIRIAYNNMILQGKTTGDILQVEHFTAAQQEVVKGIDSIQSHLNELLSGSKTLDDVIDMDSFVEGLNTLALTTGMTVEEMNDKLNSIGVQAQVETISIPKRISVPTYKEYKTWHDEENPGKITYTDATGTHEIDKPPSGYYETYTVPGPTYEVDGYEQIAQISTAENPIKPNIKSSTISSPSYTGVGGTANKGSTNRGGGVSKSSTTSSTSSSDSSSDNKTTSAASQDHEVHRYSNEENAINALSKQYERLGKEKDKAFGASRVQAMELELKKLKQLKSASKDYLDAIVGKGNGGKIAQAVAQGKSVGSLIMNGQAGGTAAADYRALYGGMDASGKGLEYTAYDSNGERLVKANYSLSDFNALFGSNINFQLDSAGRIQNKDAILNTLQNMKNQEEVNYSRLKNPSDSQKTEHSKRMAYLETIKERITQMDKTADDLSDMIDEYLEYISKVQEKNAEIITTKMENGVELGNKTQQKIDRALKVLGNDIFKSAEKMSKYYNKAIKESAKADKITEEAYDKAYAEAVAKYELYKKNPYDENAITPEQMAQIAEKVEAGYDQLIENAQGKIEMINSIYSDAMDYWKQKIDEVNSSIESNINTLTHYQNVLNLLGRSADYKGMKAVLENKLEADEYYYKEAKKIADTKKEAYDYNLKQYQAMKKSGAYSDDFINDFYEHTVKVSKEEWEEYLKKSQEQLEIVLQDINAVYENSINSIYDSFENSLVGLWGSFDEIDKAMSRQKAIADEYLTKTNQLYETNKMLRDLSKDIDKTDSSIAKRRLKDFANEIEALKTKEKLNKSDLDIAKSKYEILKAELALEEAKNAKTTVRLQRDSEGNYGYIYTADQDNISDAEAAVEEKQNNFYNLLKTQAEESGQKIVQITEEWMEAVRALEEEKANDILMTDEEYKFRRQKIDEQFHAQLLAAQETHDTAISLLNEVAAEGQTEVWTNSFEDTLKNLRVFSGNSQNETDTLANSLDMRIQRLHLDVDATMNRLNARRQYYTDLTNLGNDSIDKSTAEVSNEVKKLSNEVTKRGGLADSLKTGSKAATDITIAFNKEYDAEKKTITALETKANKVNDLTQKLITATDVQKKYNDELERTNQLLNLHGGGAGGYSNGGGSGGGGSSGGSGGGGSSGGGGGGSWVAKNDYDMIVNDYVYHNRLYYHTGTKQSKYQKEVHSWKYMYNGYHFSTKYESYRCEKCGCLKEVRHETTNGTHTYYNVGMGWQREDWTKPTPNNPKGFSYKTGGYTGAWPSSGKTGMYTGSWNGPDLEENGKLAFLHQKELVLNASDTENMLEAVKLIRQISQQIDLQAVSQSSGFALAATQFYGDREPLQQDITIHAEFPNATNHSEIEEAFINLANKASQYAYRS